MRVSRRLQRAFRVTLVSATLLVAACGGGAAPVTVSSPTAAPATSAPATPAPPTPAPASPSPSATTAPPQAGVGAASVKLSEAKQVAGSTPVHVGFIGDEALPAGTYVETLNLVTLQPGGRTISHKHGGLEIVVVTEGSVEVRTPAGAKVTLTAGQTAKVPANTPVQAVNTGSGVAKFLAFFVTADGQPFQTNLDAIP